MHLTNVKKNVFPLLIDLKKSLQILLNKEYKHIAHVCKFQFDRHLSQYTDIP